MKKPNLVFADVETTGLNPDVHEIIELGAIVVKANPDGSFAITEELEFKVKPEHIERAEPEALRINRYNSADWLFASDLKQVMTVFAEKTAGCTLVAHNVTFDWCFIDKAFKSTGVACRLDYHRLDLLSMVFAKCYNDDKLQKYNLAFLAEYFGIKNERAHTALADTRVAFEIYKKLFAGS